MAISYDGTYAPPAARDSTSRRIARAESTAAGEPEPASACASASRVSTLPSVSATARPIHSLASRFRPIAASAAPPQRRARAKSGLSASALRHCSTAAS